MSTLTAPPAADRNPDPGGRSGLAEAEAQRRLKTDGENALPVQAGRGLLPIIWAVVKEPMFLLLITAGLLYLLMGEPGDALLLLGFVAAVMAITIIQERRTERALDALRELASPQALVIRDGQRRRIPAHGVVRGDFLVLAEGDRIPADGLLREESRLTVDESSLTGESVPVAKSASESAQQVDPPGGERLPSVFSGTLVTAGHGLAEVVATGPRSQLGKIGTALGGIKPERTPLQLQTGRMVRILALVGLALSVVVVVVYAITRGGDAATWKEGLLAGITMAMAIMPEELPVVLTIFLALGAWRMSRNRVLTRRMPAIEALGAATVLCTDKTGTLTRNQMKVSRIVIGEDTTDLGKQGQAPSPAVVNLLDLAILASRPQPFDPMERAIHAAGATAMPADPARHQGWVLEREYPLTPPLLAVTQAWKRGEGEPLLVAAKGAPEAIAGLCRMSQEQGEALARQVTALAGEGLRVLGVATATWAAGQLPEQQQELHLGFVGLLALADPLRPDVPAAVAECRSAGIRVIMITGDYPATAQSIARQAGLANPESVITGPELLAMSDADLAQRIREVHVFARVAPEQKLRIVTALKANREVVAMTGDGVNDAPALKAAHIGIAMGGRGTDVARESASLVLLDDDFTSIVVAVKMGRRIFDNIRKAVAFTFAVHVPIAGLSMLPIFDPAWPLLLLPVHIVFLEMVVNPTCTLIFEAEEAESDLMRRPPRDPEQRLFSWSGIALSLLQGLGILVVCIGVFWYARSGHGENAARAMTFVTLVSACLAVIITNRSWTRGLFAILRAPNPAQWWVVLGTVALIAVALYVPVARTLFHFAPLDLLDTVAVVLVGVMSVGWFEVYKYILHHVREPVSNPH